MGKSDNARRQILAAAAQMLRDKGYSDMALRDLAAEVGMKAGSLYYHFPSKDALVLEVLQWGVQLVHRAVQKEISALDEASPRDRLVRALQVHLETLVSASDFTSAHIRCYVFLPRSLRADLAQPRREYDALWIGLVEDYLGADGDPTQVRYLHKVLIGALNSSLEWFDTNTDQVDSYIRAIADLLAEPRTAEVQGPDPAEH